MRSALTDYDPQYRRIATQTGLPGPSVDHQLFLIRTLFPLAVHVVSEAGASELNPSLQHCRNRSEQSSPVARSKLVGSPLGVNPGFEECLVRVDVPDARNESLIEKQGLDAQAPIPESFPEAIPAIGVAEGFEAQT